MASYMTPTNIIGLIAISAFCAAGLLNEGVPRIKNVTPTADFKAGSLSPISRTTHAIDEPSMFVKLNSTQPLSQTDRFQYMQQICTSLEAAACQIARATATERNTLEIQVHPKKGATVVESDVVASLKRHNGLTLTSLEMR